MNHLDVHAAWDEAMIERLPLQGEAEALRMLEAAHAAHRDRGRWLSPARRVEILRGLRDQIAGRVEELATQAAREGGKPLQDSLVEIRRAVEGVETAIEVVRTLGGTEIPMNLGASSAGRLAYTYREPRGVVLAISAFNHPFNLVVHQAVTAIAAGCPVIVKPALATPLSCRALIEMLHRAGTPPEHCHLLVCEDAVAERLVGDPRVAFLTFIGSARVGWHLRSRLAPGAACALEHGGVAPAVLDDTADVEAAVPLLVKGGFYHAGQVCVSVQRVYVPRSGAGAFLDRFVPAVRALRVGDPTDPATEVGPLIRRREVERVGEWVDEAVAGGGRLACGGRALGPTAYEPTVVVDPPDDVRLSTEEVFGPVVAVYGYDDLDEAVRRANAPDVFFQAAVFTRRLDVALDLSRRLRGMAVMVNDHTAFRVDWMPFGGHMLSGLGRGGIRYTIEDMSLERMLVFRTG